MAVAGRLYRRVLVAGLGEMDRQALRQMDPGAERWRYIASATGTGTGHLCSGQGDRLIRMLAPTSSPDPDQRILLQCRKRVEMLQCGMYIFIICTRQRGGPAKQERI